MSANCSLNESTLNLGAPLTVDKPSAKSSFALPVALFACTSFLSAFLLFEVQLIVNKHILPWFGGSAAVWTTSMLVFQLLLLAGYIYSHLISSRLSISKQFLVHGVLLSLAGILVIALSVAWPSAITPSATFKGSQTDHPIAAVCLIVLLATGLPFFVLSTSAPLLQSWFGQLGAGKRTYRLYALSNLGSLLGLLAFPFLLEPVLGLKVQGQIWALLFCLFVGMCLMCGLQARAFGQKTAAVSNEDSEASASTKPRRMDYALWFLLAGCASALLLASTNLLCQEVIAVPLLWVLPLSIYLLSFIICFDHSRWYQRTVFHPLFATALFITCAALSSNRNFMIRLVSPLLVLFATCMICHGELVRLKPGIKHLTSFYLTISAGGATGGVFVALIAPKLFTSTVEFQLSLGMAVVLLLVTLVRDHDSWIHTAGFLVPLACTVAAVGAAYVIARWVPEVAPVLDRIRFYPATVLLGTVIGLSGFTVERSATDGKFRSVSIFVVVIALGSFVALYYSAQPKPGLISASRNFYGVVQVFRDGDLKELIVGQTAHGAQYDSPPNDRYPLTYYGPDSGVGAVLRNHPKRTDWVGHLRVGVVGLGTGTLAAYGHPGDTIRFYELDPDVVKLTTGDRPTFTYVRDSRASVTTVLGDARLSLEREASEGKTRQFDVLVLDAFSGDAIPTHLLTKEAFDTYWKQLDSEQGIIAVHITSRHVDLVPVLMGAAQHYQAKSLMTYNRRHDMVFDSGWFLMSKSPDALNLPGLESITVQYVHNVASRLWTDDRSDVFRLIY